MVVTKKWLSEHKNSKIFEEESVQLFDPKRIVSTIDCVHKKMRELKNRERPLIVFKILGAIINIISQLMRSYPCPLK